MVKICPSILTLYPNTHHTTHSDSTLTFSLPPKPTQPGMGNPCTDRGKCYHCEENLYLRSIHVLTNRTEIYTLFQTGGIWARCDIRNQTQELTVIDRWGGYCKAGGCLLPNQSFSPLIQDPTFKPCAGFLVLPMTALQAPCSPWRTVLPHFSVFREWRHPPFSAKTRWLAVCVSDLYSSVVLFSSGDTDYSLSSILFGYLSPIL